MIFQLKQHDTRKPLKVALESESGAVDLTNASVRFLMSDYSYNSVIDGTANIQNASTGEVWYVFDYGETDQAGAFKAEFEVTFSDGKVETFPADDYIPIEIIKDLG